MSVNQRSIFGTERLQVFFQAGDLTITARPGSIVDMRQGPSGPVHKPEDGGKKQDAKKKQRKSVRGRPHGR